MGQEEILNVLENREWLTARELAEATDTNQGNVSLCLKKLLKNRNVIMRKVKTRTTNNRRWINQWKKT